MKHMVLTALTATALALSPMASAPAKAADTKDVLGAILGIAAVAAIANELKEDRDERNQVNRQNRRILNDDRYRHDDRYRNKHRRNARVLPGECLRVAEGRRNNDRIVFPELCLNNNGIRTHQLPRRCESRVNARRGRIDVYGARCLADAGWSLPRIATRY